MFVYRAHVFQSSVYFVPRVQSSRISELSHENARESYRELPTRAFSENQKEIQSSEIRECISECSCTELTYFRALYFRAVQRALYTSILKYTHVFQSSVFHYDSLRMLV